MFNTASNLFKNTKAVSVVDFYVTPEGSVLPTEQARIDNIINNLDFYTPPNKAIFYSGYGNEAAAADFAIENGGMLITDTSGGVALSKSGRLPEPIYRKYWGKASEKFADQASGTVNAYVDGYSSNSIFNLYELPALNKNNTIIIFKHSGE